MTFNDLEDAVKLLYPQADYSVSVRHVAMVYAHNDDDFVRVLIGAMNMTVYSRAVPPDTGFAASVAGIPILSQPFLLPGTALLIDQFGQIMQVCRYQDEASEDEASEDKASQNDVNNEGETGNAKS